MQVIEVQGTKTETGPKCEHVDIWKNKHTTPQNAKQTHVDSDTAITAASVFKKSNLSMT